MNPHASHNRILKDNTYQNLQYFVSVCSRSETTTLLGRIGCSVFVPYPCLSNYVSYYLSYSRTAFNM